MGKGMMWKEFTWELNGKWECGYGNVREWELETHSRSPLVGEYMGGAAGWAAWAMALPYFWLGGPQCIWPHQ